MTTMGMRPTSLVLSSQPAFLGVHWDSRVSRSTVLQTNRERRARPVGGQPYGGERGHAKGARMFGTVAMVNTSKQHTVAFRSVSNSVPVVSTWYLRHLLHGQLG